MTAEPKQQSYHTAAFTPTVQNVDGYKMVDCVLMPAQQLKQHRPHQSLRGATGGVETVRPDFLVIESLLSMPPSDALLPSDPSCVDETDTASGRLKTSIEK